jgi:hypothetical protein
MNKDAHDLNGKQRGLSRKQVMVGGFILLLVLSFLGYFWVVRPVLVMVPGRAGIDVKNQGGMGALIYKVDGFWYWGGQVALLGNMPAIHQHVEATGHPVRLQLPGIPNPSEEVAQKGPCYMKLAVRYGIPGNPIFRYTAVWYFVFDPIRQAWTPTKTIPPRYRALGNVAMGNVREIELDF